MNWLKILGVFVLVVIIFVAMPFAVIVWYCSKKEGDVDDMVDISIMFLVGYSVLIGAMSSFIMWRVLWSM